MEGQIEAQANRQDGCWAPWTAGSMGGALNWEPGCCGLAAGGGWHEESMHHVRASFGRDLYLKARTLMVADVCFRGNGSEWGVELVSAAPGAPDNWGEGHTASLSSLGPGIPSPYHGLLRWG